MIFVKIIAFLMVWFTDRFGDSGANLGCVVPEDRTFQSVNIMLNVHKLYDAHNLHIFQSTGVNIFNVDRTIHSEIFSKNIHKALIKAEGLPELYPKPYYTPVGWAITMSAHKIVCVDDRVDIIILKDVTNTNVLIQVKRENAKLSSMPIMLWLSILNEDTMDLIKISDGIILDLKNDNYFLISTSIAQMCKQAKKPIFYFNSNLIQDYAEMFCNDRKILGEATKLIEGRIDGVMLDDSSNTVPPTKLIVSLGKALRAAEGNINIEKDYFELSSSIKVPIIAPLATALAASLAAMKHGASAIIVFTASGASAKIVANAAPPCPVLAITARITTTRRLHLYRRVMPLFYDSGRASCWHEEYHNRLSFGIRFALKTGLFCSGAKLVVLAPSEDNVGYCDTFQIITVPFKCPE